MNLTQPRVLIVLLLVVAAACKSRLEAQALLTAEQLKSFSLQQLLNVKVVSVSRYSEPWWTAPGAIDIVTGDEIMKSGAMSLPDALRLATGVDVALSQSATWSVGIRGFSVPGGNKINALIDGRALYTPFYSGIFWDAQDVMLADVDRIEVVRGPVGALWGAYAVNGLIQIFTKSAWDTQGTLTSAAYSTDGASVDNARYGGDVGKATAFRVYAQYRQLPAMYFKGHALGSATDLGQTGFRSDTNLPSGAAMTLEGDFYSNKDLFLHGTRDVITGGSLSAQWRKLLASGNSAGIQSYFDYTSRDFAIGLSEVRRTFQLNGKYHLVGRNHELLIGTDNSISSDTVGNLPYLVFSPSSKVSDVISAYANYTQWLTPKLSTTLAAKEEHNSFSGFEFQPSVRLAYTPTGKTTWWGAISRAVRTPVRFDQDVQFPGAFVANKAFRSEEVWAYEAGVRRRLTANLVLDIATFWNAYDRLRSYQPLGSAPAPLTFRNMLNARERGVEATLIWQLNDMLRLKADYRNMDQKFWQDPGSRNPFGTRYEADDPRQVGMVMASYAFARRASLTADLRAVSSRPFRGTPAYATADFCLALPVAAHWELSIIGRNLLQPSHLEQIIPQNTSQPGYEVPRSVAVRMSATF